MGSMKIRETLPEDAEKILAFMKKAGGETDNLTFGKEGLSITAEQEREYLGKVCDDKRSVQYSVWKDEEIIGIGSLSGSLRRMSHRAELALMVAMAEWNKGVGSMLLEKLIAYARQNEIEIISLEVRHDNTKAIHLYEKYGFKRIGTIPAYFKIGSRYFDFEAMYLDLRKADLF